MTTLNESAYKVAALKVLLDRVRDAYDTARSDLQGQMAEVGATQVKPSLAGQPLAVASLAAGRVTATVTDADKFASWVHENHPTETVAVLTVRPAWQAAFLAELAKQDTDEPYDPGTGLFVEGVAVTHGEPYVTVRMTGEQRERIAESLAQPGYAAALIAAPKEVEA